MPSQIRCATPGTSHVAASLPVKRTAHPTEPKSKGRDPESPPVVAELERIRVAGDAIRTHGMRFNAGHALNYANVQPVARMAGVRELHIGHAIVSRAVFVGIRDAVREMKSLMVGAARSAAGSR